MNIMECSVYVDENWNWNGCLWKSYFFRGCNFIVTALENGHSAV